MGEVLQTVIKPSEVEAANRDAFEEARKTDKKFEKTCCLIYEEYKRERLLEDWILFVFQFYFKIEIYFTMFLNPKWLTTQFYFVRL